MGGGQGGSFPPKLPSFPPNLQASPPNVAYCQCVQCLYSTTTIIIINKHRASEVLLYIGGHGLVSQIIEPVTFARCAFIIALRNIALDGYLDTRRNI